MITMKSKLTLSQTRNIWKELQKCNEETLFAIMESQEFLKLHDVYTKFLQQLESPMAKFWQSYIDMVFLLLRFICATHQGHWELRKACIRDMLPWFFAYDCTNYARYLSVYWSNMINLPSTNPDAELALASGELSVQRTIIIFHK